MPGVVVLSWYPPGVADEHGKPTEDVVPAVMDAAHRHSIKVTGERSIKLICLHKHLVYGVFSDVFVLNTARNEYAQYVPLGVKLL